MYTCLKTVCEVLIPDGITALHIRNLVLLPIGLSSVFSMDFYKTVRFSPPSVPFHLSLPVGVSQKLLHPHVKTGSICEDVTLSISGSS